MSEPIPQMHKYTIWGHIENQRRFSERTFGPGIRRGVVDHIKKELKEVEDSDLKDLEEWIDIVILGLDGAWRTGASSEDIVRCLKMKQRKNEQRVWPDWRTQDRDKAIEHDRTHD